MIRFLAIVALGLLVGSTYHAFVTVNGKNHSWRFTIAALAAMESC